MIALLAMLVFASGTEHLTQAKKFYERFKYEEGLAELSLALEDKSLSLQQRASIYFLVAVGKFNLGNDVDGEQAVANALELNPDIEAPPLTSPKIRSSLERARARFKSRPTPELNPPLSHPPPAEGVVQPQPASKGLLQRKWPALVVWGVSVASLGAAVGFGVAGNGEHRAAELAMYALDVPGHNARAADFATTANVLFSVAAGTALVGLLLALLL